MNFSRRETLMSALFGTSLLGLRALVSGVPAAMLLRGRDAFADGTAPTCADASKAQFIIMSTSGAGDPLNANVPGTYEDSGIVHCTDPTMTPTAMTIGGQATMAAAPWATLPQNVLDRMNFWHIMTNTPVHPREPDVLKLLGATSPTEMLPSMLSRQLAPCLGTIQTQPITLGAATPSESLSYQGQALPIIPPLALKATLTNAAGSLTNLQSLRDSTLSTINGIYRSGATSAQKAYLDELATSQTQVRSIRQDLLASLAGITDNTITSQITAAITLIQMNITPVIVVHVPFGGDNHNDAALATEAAETVSGVAAIASLMSQLATAGLQDKVSFMSLNVFGRTIGAGNTNGRQHNLSHQVSLSIGKPFKGGIIGGVAPAGGDYGALSIDSQTGAGSAGGDIAVLDTLASFGKTMMSAVGIDSSYVETVIPSGKVVKGALA